MSGDVHRVLREQVGAYALGQLTGEQHQAVSDHLQTCGLCQADLAEIAPVADLLSVARDQVTLDDLAGPDRGANADLPPLSPALLAEVRATDRPVSEGAGPAAAKARARWSRSRVPLAAAAAAAVLVAAGLGFALATAAAPPAVPQEAVAVRVLDPAVQAQAALVAHTWGMEVKLVATGFAPGGAYRVTVTDDAGRTVGAGEFIGTGAQEMRCNLNSSILRTTAANVEVTDPNGNLVLDALV